MKLIIAAVSGSVWIIALTGCGAKHSAQLPLAEQDLIRLQAKAAAAADAKRDVAVLASFGAGMGATFAAGMCGLMTGFIADATFGQGQDDLFYLTASVSAAGAFFEGLNFLLLCAIFDAAPVCQYAPYSRTYCENRQR